MASDAYPTRLAEPAAVLDRVDPVVWGEEPGPLAAAALRAYGRDGYLIEQGLFDQAEVNRIAAAAAEVRGRVDLHGDPRVVRERLSAQIRSIFEVHRFHQTLAETVLDPRLVDRARQVLGSDVYIHQCRINYMPGLTGKGFYWHSDFETWHAEDGMPTPRAISASIALTPNYPYNGSLMVMPGSHRRFVPCVGATPAGNFRNSLAEQQVGVPAPGVLGHFAAEFGIDQFTGPAGSVLLFDSNLIHGSTGNITPLPRSNLFVVFNSTLNTLVEPFAAPSRRPDYLADRDFVPLGQPPK